jgi:DNA-binding MarR family transcriptional regulator
VGERLEAGALARSLYQERSCRSALLPADLLGEPAWDILLDLFASEHEQREISVSSACIASSAPPTTGLRYLAKLETAGLVERSAAAGDRRRFNLRLTPEGRAAMSAILERIAAQRSLLLPNPAPLPGDAPTAQEASCNGSAAASQPIKAGMGAGAAPQITGP